MTTSATPRMRIDAACDRLGRNAVIERCRALLVGGTESADFVLALGGPPAMHLLAEGLPSGQAYWLRVWAARGLLWAGPGECATELRVALSDTSWRVREMACKVIARHRIDELFDDVVALEGDENERVCTAATRAARRLAGVG